MKRVFTVLPLLFLNALLHADLPKEGLILDLDADKGLTTSPDNRISCWRNQAPVAQARDFIQQDKGRKTPGSGRPSLKQSVEQLNGHNSVVFRRQELVNHKEDAFDHLITGSGYTWFSVMCVYEQVVQLKDVNSFFGNLRNGGKYEGIWGNLTDDNRVWTGSRNGITFGRWDKNNPMVLASEPLEKNRYYIVCGRMGAGKGTVPIEVFINSGEKPAARKPFPVNPRADSSKLAIGQERDAINHPGKESFDGEIARFLVYERPLRDAELAQTMQHLARSYSIADVTQAQKKIHIKTMQELKRALGDAEPGTTITLAPGTYRGGLHCSKIRGTDDAPITITSRDKDNPAVFTSQLQFSEPRNLILKDFVVTGSSTNGLNIDDGGTFSTPASQITLSGLMVLDTGPKGNRDGIKLSGVQDFLITGCTIKDWGSGGSAVDMVGCHRGLIRECLIDGRKRTAATGIQCKGGTSAIVIRSCRFFDGGTRAVNIGGSTGEPYYRPQGAKHESRKIIVTGNFFSGSTAPIAFTGATESQVCYNTISDPGKWIMRILQEKPVPPYVTCSNNTFSHNIIVWYPQKVHSHVNISPNTKPATFRFISNMWYAVDAPQRSRPHLPAPEAGGIYGKDPHLRKQADGTLGALKKLSYGPAAEGEQKRWLQEFRKLVPWAGK